MQAVFFWAGAITATIGMVKVYMPYTPDLKALYILRANVRALLAKRKESEALLALALGFKHRSSLNKFLNSERAGFQMSRLDKLAAFFGLPVYQLFQPGISPLAERRISGERRSKAERRIGHSHRVMLHTAAEIDSHRPVRKGESHVAVVASSPTLVALTKLTAEYERRITALLAQAESGGQTPRARPAFPAARQGRRTPRGSDAAEP